MSGAARIVVEGVWKRFGATQALEDVSVSFRAGEAHALMGENGAGKSTLGKVIAGLHRPDSGSVVIEGRPLRLGSVDDAFDAGVRIVHQELAQCANLSVAENLCLHATPRTRLGLVDFSAMSRRAEKLLAELEPGIDVEAPLGSLAPGRRQICQIAAALDDTAARPGGSPAKVIVLDEPTSSLSLAETERLLQIVRDLSARGLTMIYVSHRMGEIFACCDRVTVLRDGKWVATSDVKQIDEPALIEQMIGRRVAIESAPSAAEPDAPPRLRVEGLSSPGVLHDISLEVAPGEIVGLGGLVGAGRSELLEAIFGLDSRARGAIRVDGAELPVGDPRAAIRAGVGFVPEDRRLEGLFLNLGVDENILAPVMGQCAGPLGLRREAAERQLVRQRVSEFRIKTATMRSHPDELSGGNQQKLLLARWMSPDVRVLLLDEPTRGIDVGTKAEVHRLIRAAAARGVATLLVSSEMPELLALADRVVVLAGGRITGELTGEQRTQRDVLTLAARDTRAN